MKNKKIYSIYMLACMLNIGILFSTSPSQIDNRSEHRTSKKSTCTYNFLTPTQIDDHLQTSYLNPKEEFILVIPNPVGEVSVHQIATMARSRELSLRLIMLNVQDITERVLSFLNNLKMLPPDIAASEDNSSITHLAILVGDLNDEQSKLLINLLKKYQVGSDFLSFWLRTKEAISNIKQFINVTDDDKPDIDEMGDYGILSQVFKVYNHSIRGGSFNFKKDAPLGH